MKKNILSIGAFACLSSNLLAQATAVDGVPEILISSPSAANTTYTFIKPNAAANATVNVTFSVQQYVDAIGGSVGRSLCNASYVLGGTLTGVTKTADLSLTTGTGQSQTTLTITLGAGIVNGQAFTLTIKGNTTGVANVIATALTKSGAANSCVTAAPRGNFKQTFSDGTTPLVAVADAVLNFVVSGPLAVELLNFEGKPNGNKVDLAWATASEKDNATFEIQRSYDAINFTTIGSVKGNGTTNEAHNYAYTDATATGAIAYYRLKDIDVTGQDSYSQIVGVKLGKGSKLEVSTIATELGLVTFNAMEEGDATLSVVNLSGQVVAQAQATATEGNNVVPMNLNALANGIYLLQVRTANSTVTKKFVKN